MKVGPAGLLTSRLSAYLRLVFGAHLVEWSSDEQECEGAASLLQMDSSHLVTTPLWAALLLRIVIVVVGYDFWRSVLEHLHAITWKLNHSLLDAADTREFLV